MAMRVGEACDAFLETLRGKSPHTRTTYQTALNHFREFLTGLGRADCLTTELPGDILETFYLWLVGQYGREKQFTVLSHISGVRSFFRFLERRKEGPAGTSFEGIKAGLREVMAKVNYKAPLPDPELPLVVLQVNEAAEKPVASDRERLRLLRDRAIINVLYCTGMRREEVSRLDRQHVQEGYANQAIITGKGEKDRTVFFDEETLGYIRAYLVERKDAYPPLFIQHGPARGQRKRGRRDHRLSPQSIWKTVKRWTELTGLDKGRLTTHDFRHMKASTLLNRGAQLSEVQDLLGHASPETTKKIYAHYEVSHLREAFEKFSVPAEELAAGLGDRPRRPASSAKRRPSRPSPRSRPGQGPEEGKA
ncbi:MAG: tyrosine-type recombinase/integrase [Actinobacteria bacterium]|nr:tyrosine-type recombinase/integrase [Actinomycetota bacterium]